VTTVKLAAKLSVVKTQAEGIEEDRRQSLYAYVRARLAAEPR
jgi:hypothetical protein